MISMNELLVDERLASSTKELKTDNQRNVEYLSCEWRRRHEQPEYGAAW
jgi:hypothetical protein